MSNDQTYNGWTNYETWLVKLWIDNSEGDQEHWQERARECVQDAIRSDESEPREAAVTALAQELEDSHDEQVGEVFPQNAGLMHDLLTGALGRVEWREIARSMVDEVEIWSAGWNMPGYMPDNPPALFTDCDSARNYVSDAMDDAAEGYADDIEDGDQYSAKTKALEEASLRCLKGSGEFGETVAGYHYFVTKV